MQAVDIYDRQKLSSLFDKYSWNYFPDAILEGEMGKAYADDQNNPNVAILKIPNLNITILGGNSKHPAAKDYVKNFEAPQFMLFASKGWEALFHEVYGGRIAKMERYAFSSEKLDIDHLKELRSKLPNEYSLEKLTKKLATDIANEESEFTADHMVNFESPKDFIDRGFGFCILIGGEIVSIATTFAVCEKGVEIQISTRKDHQRKGLGTVIAAQFLIYCLENNKDPNWDAENMKSAGLAKKLGYIPQGSYWMYILARSRIRAMLGKVLLKLKE